MVDESPKGNKPKGYWFLVFAEVKKDHKLSPFLRGPMAAMIAAIFKWHFSTGTSGYDLVVLVAYAFSAYLALWATEFALRLLFITPARLYKQQRQKIETLEAAKTPKLIIEGIRCQWLINEDCLCSVSIRNVSTLEVAENVSVRIEGRVANKEMYAPGYDPFHDADLLPMSGQRSINPNSTVDFIFPVLINQMVTLLGRNNSATLFVQSLCSSFSNDKPLQTFKITASALKSPLISEEFVIVANQNQQMSIIRNIQFHKE